MITRVLLLCVDFGGHDVGVTRHRSCGACADSLWYSTRPRRRLRSTRPLPLSNSGPPPQAWAGYWLSCSQPGILWVLLVSEIQLLYVQKVYGVRLLQQASSFGQRIVSGAYGVAHTA